MFGFILLVSSIALTSSLPQLGSISEIRNAFNGFKSRLQCAELPNDGTCAMLFDEDDCTGWQLKVKEGYTEIASQSFTDFIAGSLVDEPKKDDAEAVLVRNGCTLFAYDRPEGHILGKGDTAAITAARGDRFVKLEDEFEDLDEEIEAVNCVCSGAAGR